MRVGLLVVAALALIGFVAVAVVLPEMAGAKSKEAAQALIAGAEPGQHQVGQNAERAGKLAGAGKGVRVAGRDNQHGSLKWIVEDDGTIRGWNEQNALEIALTPTLESGKVAWRCKGYPVSSMPPACGGR